MNVRSLLFTLVLLPPFGGSAVAQDILYTPVNPSFGGSPLNSSHLLGTASAQRTATARDADDDDDIVSPVTGGGDDEDEQFDLFVRQLQSRLLSALSAQVTDAIFGDDPQDTGTVTFGDQSIFFERTATAIRLVITDFATGQTTEIIVPQLVTDAGATAASLGATSLSPLGDADSLSQGLMPANSGSDGLSPQLNIN